MNIAHIVPVKQMYLIEDQPIAMFLTHLVENYPEYEHFAKNFKGYKILDNSLIEVGKAMSIGRVIDAACRIHADEIILPDVFRSSGPTLHAVESGLTTIDTMGMSQAFYVMAVAQGHSAETFKQCYEALEKINEIDVIGIPKITAKLHPKGRPYFEPLWFNSHKSIHLLGLWYSFIELSAYRALNRIRSVDTCLASFFTLHGLEYASAVRPDGFTIDLENTTIDDGGFEVWKNYCNRFVQN